MKLTPEQLLQRRKELHRALDELLACWLQHGDGLERNDEGRIATGRPIMDLMSYSAAQATGPVSCSGERHRDR